ncbi:MULTISPECIES: hypothetical protein [Bacillaceae]|uniref:Uncharacterized protein n=1 Tax=Metabacillus sediminis TaxID=3117746 RepID=A0ABZ2NEB9_9BACI|nr:hypothetical protein [Bacillus sp. SJS]KZZ86322.1 hypothetical protein AS29_001755 [Bacillus sp. SJS]
MYFERAQDSSDTDWIKAKQISALLITEWHVSEVTQRASPILMHEDYESLYKIMRLSLYANGSIEPVCYDYPIYSSSGKMKLYTKSGFHAFQLKLLFFNSSNMMLAAAKTPDLSFDLSKKTIDSFQTYFSAYTDYGEWK